MKMKLSVGLVLGAVALTACADGQRVRQVFLPPQYMRGNVNVKIQNEIDKAAWVWMPGHDVWGVSADAAERRDDLSKMKNRPASLFRFRNRFESDGSPLRFDVSADERFTLYLDGQPIARGPQRGLVDHWYFQSYEVTGLKPGSHLIEAVCWQLGVRAPRAQLSYRGGFVFRAEGKYDGALTTGKGKWEVAPLAGTTMTDRGTSHSFGAGSQCEVIGTGFVNERPDESAWQPAAVVRGGVRSSVFGAHTKGWMLYPADRPDQMYAVNGYALRRMARFLNRKSQRRYRLKYADTYYGELNHYGMYWLKWADVRR